MPFQNSIIVQFIIILEKLSLVSNDLIWDKGGQDIAAVSFLYVAWVWLGRIVLGRRRTGLGTGFIA